MIVQFVELETPNFTFQALFEVHRTATEIETTLLRAAKKHCDQYNADYDYFKSLITGGCYTLIKMPTSTVFRDRQKF